MSGTSSWLLFQFVMLHLRVLSSWSRGTPWREKTIALHWILLIQIIQGILIALNEPTRFDRCCCSTRLRNLAMKLILVLSTCLLKAIWTQIQACISLTCDWWSFISLKEQWLIDFSLVSKSLWEHSTRYVSILIIYRHHFGAIKDFDVCILFNFYATSLTLHIESNSEFLCFRYCFGLEVIGVVVVVWWWQGVTLLTQVPVSGCFPRHGH